jgi:hypothetical protein
MLEIWIFIFFFLFLFIYNACFLIEGFREGADPSEDAGDPYRDPPNGPEPDREEVDPPPTEPPSDEDIEDLVPEETDPIKPNCECFDTQTEIFLAKNALAYRQLEEDIKIIKAKIQQANAHVNKNDAAIEQNRTYDLAMCCKTGKEDACAELNEQDCSEILG